MQIHHNPIKLADFAIICRFPQSGSSKKIQPILRKQVVANQPDRAPQKPGEVDGTVWSEDGHTPLLSLGGLQRDGLQPQKPSNPQLSSWPWPRPRQALVKHHNSLHDPLHNLTTMSQRRFKRFPPFATLDYLFPPQL